MYEVAQVRLREAGKILYYDVTGLKVKVGEYVIVHAGFALNVLNEEEAMEVFEMLSQMEDLAASEMSS